MPAKPQKSKATYLKRERRREKINKHLKRRRDKPPRRRNWQEWDVEDLPTAERIMPRDEGERRRMIEARLSTKTDSPSSDDTPPGRVVEVSASLCRVMMDDRTILCELRGSLSHTDSHFTNVVAVGDEVIISENGSGQGVVERVLPRRSMLARPDVHHHHLQQVIAANVDQLLIVSAWQDPPVWLALIDRYLITAERHDLTSIICINKIDLAPSQQEVAEFLQPYTDLGYDLVLTSGIAGIGLDDLATRLADRVTVIAGMSGVGKSTLLTAIQPDLALKTQTVSTDTGFGRHTTTQVNMWPLAMGGYVVDTPGVREFGLDGLSRAELPAYYPEFVALAPYCRFKDCSHLREPDCAVRAAVQRGTVAKWRHHSYKRILESLPT